MYYHTQYTHRVNWNPDNDSIAYQAIVESQHTDISSVSEAKEVCPIEVTYEESQDINQLYRELNQHTLHISLQDGNVVGDGSDSEDVTVKLKQGESLVTGQHTVELVVDGFNYDVDTTDGVGTHSVTTSKQTGSNVSVQAVDVVELDSVTQSREKAINVS